MSVVFKHRVCECMHTRIQVNERKRVVVAATLSLPLPLSKPRRPVPVVCCCCYCCCFDEREMRSCLFTCVASIDRQTPKHLCVSSTGSRLLGEQRSDQLVRAYVSAMLRPMTTMVWHVPSGVILQVRSRWTHSVSLATALRSEQRAGTRLLATLLCIAR